MIDVSLGGITVQKPTVRACGAGRCRTSLPVLTQPLTSWIKPRPIILNSMMRVRGSSTCSFVARSDLSFMFAYELGPFRFTPTPIVYGTSILDRRDEYFARAS